MSSKEALFLPMQACFSSCNVLIAASVSFTSLAFKAVFKTSCVCRSARVSTHSVIKSLAALLSPMHFCLSFWQLSIAAVNAVLVLLNSTSAACSLPSSAPTFSLMSANSSVDAADSPTHFCFSSWHVLIVDSHSADFSSIIALVFSAVVSSSSTFFLQSVMMVLLSAYSPTHFALAACSDLSDSSSALVSVSYFSCHVSTWSSSCALRLLASSNRSPCASSLPSNNSVLLRQ